MRGRGHGEVIQNADYNLLIRSCYESAMSDGQRFRAALSRAADAWSVAMSRAQADALFVYGSLLLTWSSRINLTGATSLDDLVAEHLPDSFALASRLADPGISVVDVGSGGGLPALPLAILRPELGLRLVEPIAKKGAFLRTAVRQLALGARVTVAVQRAETLLPATFDVAISRAALPPPAWIGLASQLVRPGGRAFVLASSGSDPGDAVAPFRRAGRWSYSDDRRALIELILSDEPSDSTPPSPEQSSIRST
jgi:16S rRNA (guanine527-N7)-methyltransferase